MTLFLPTRKLLSVKRFSLALFLVLIVSWVQAQTTRTSTTAGGSWNATTTWLGGVVPAATDNAVIDGPVSIPNNTTLTIADLTINNGKTLTLGNKDLTVNGTVTIVGNGAMSGTRILYGTTKALVYTGSVAKTTGNEWPAVSGPTSVTILNTAGVTLNAAKTITTLTIGANARFIPATNALTVNGVTTVDGIYTVGTGAQTFNGDVVINTGGTWNGSANTAVTFGGSLRNNGGTFTAGTGTYTFSGSGKFLSGTLAIPNMSVTGFYTNDAALTVSTALTGGGTLKQGGGANLTIGGAISIANLEATVNPTNIVTYNSNAAQTVGNYAYGNLTLSGAGAKTLPAPISPATALTVIRDLTITGGPVTANGNVTVGGNFDLLNGTFNAGTFTHTVGGNLTNATGIARGTSTFVFNAPAYQTIGTGSFYNVTFSGGGNKVATGNLTVANDLTIDANTTFSASPSPNTHNHSIGHNWINNGIFDAGTGTITFNGAAAQSIGGAAATAFYNFTINNAAGVTLNKATSIQGVLTFSKGNINSSTANLLIFNDNATVAGVSDASFVNGPVQKIGNDTFTFPVGKAGAGYHPIAISAPVSATQDGGTFTAEYIRASARALSDNREANLEAVSACEYWNLNRVAGPAVKVTLFYNANSPCDVGGYITDPATLVVAHLNAPQWHSHGGTTPPESTGASGSVTSLNDVDDFNASPFTLGTANRLLNPLPVTFVSFKGRQVANGTQLNWEVAGETAVKGYDVERKTAGGQFEKIGFVAATGSSSYTFTDATRHNGAVFYRLKNIDQDGKFTYSTILAFKNGAGAIVFQVFPTVTTGSVTIQHEATSSSAVLSLSTADGKQVKLVKPQAGSMQTKLDMSGLRAGLYLLKWSDGNGYTETTKLIKQ